MRALHWTPEECIGVGAALADAPRRHGVGEPARARRPRPTVRVAEEGDELLYEAVISELAPHGA